ncbi:SRP-independent targeting protein 2 [Lachancea thermotolerans]
MAGKASKKQAHTNAAVLKRLYTVAGAVLALAAVRLLLSGGSWFKLIAFHAPAAACVYMLEKGGRPKFDADGRVVREGMDLNQEGLTEWMFDIVYLSLFADVGHAVFNTSKFWYVMLLVPVYLGYKIKGVAGPMLGGMRNAQAPSAGAPASASAKSKRQTKRDKNADKIRYKYK